MIDAWIKEQLESASRAPQVDDSLGMAMALAEKRGIWAEFGVAGGNSLWAA